MSKTHRRSFAHENSPATDAHAAPAVDGSGLDSALGMQDTFGNAFAVGEIHRLATGAASPPADPASTFEKATGGQGSAVPYRSEMEASFGEDFSGVRAHVGQAEPMRSLGAKAAASGADMAFADARPSREVVAHELTHVVQDRKAGGTGAVSGKAEVSTPGDASEREADRVAQAVGAGDAVEVHEAPSGSIQGGWLDDAVLGVRNAYHDVAEGVGIESADEASAARLQAFRDHGLFGPRDLVPPTNLGGFEASYDPQSMLLQIRISGGVNFTDGLSLDESTGIITSNTTDLDQAAIDGMALPDLDSKKSFVADFVWTDKATWLGNLSSRVASAWEAGFVFQCQRPGWDTQLANTDVNVDVHEGAKGAKEHLQVTVYKVPENGSYSIGSYVDGNADDPNNAFDDNPYNNSMVLGSTDVENGPDVPSLLRSSVQFANNSAALDADATAALDGFAADFQDANLDLSNPVELVGRANSKGSESYNKKMAQARLDAVIAYLSGKGFTNMAERVSSTNKGEEGAGEGDEWCRVDLVVCGGRGQFVAAHEFGHAFGLLDEYSVNPGGNISGTGLPVGTITGNQQMAQAIGAPGSVAENNDNLMSLGSVVRPQHYATFGWALRTVSNVDEWKVL